MEEMFHGAFGQSVSVFDGFVNLLGVELITLFPNGLEKSNYDKRVQSCVALTVSPVLIFSAFLGGRIVKMSMKAGCPFQVGRVPAVRHPAILPS